MTSSRSEREHLESIPRAPDGGPDLDRLPVELRPNESLLTYYVISSLVLGPLFFLLLIPRYFRFRTLRYRIDDEGIAMQWGILFHREVSLSYARIQDIHLTSNVVERWRGLGKIEIQTASASAGAEMTIEGIPGLEGVRDFLYGRMRGAKKVERSGATPAGTVRSTGGTAGAAAALEGPEASAPSARPAGGEELADTLLAVVEEIRGLRRDLATTRGARDSGATSDG